MKNIIKGTDVSKIRAVIYPGRLNKFTEPINQEVLIPGEFLIGSRWIISHVCEQCKNVINAEENDSNFWKIGYLSIARLKNKELLKLIGDLFKLKLKHEVDENSFEIYNYSLTGKYKDIAYIGYYKCNNCSSQYLIAYSYLFGETERNPTPDEIYIEKILQVSFDHDEFMKILKESGGRNS